jgi:hypothetical protein
MNRLLVVLSCCALLSGCFWQREVSPSARCADVVGNALPTGSVDIVRRTSEGEMTTSSARVYGRIDGRDVVAECQFQAGILSGFRWVQGPL